MRQHTVNIEGAIALGGEDGRKVFDWPNKMVVQLTVREAYQVLALLENKIRALPFDGHGRAHDKSLQIESQDSAYRPPAATAAPFPSLPCSTGSCCARSRTCASKTFA